MRESVRKPRVLASAHRTFFLVGIIALGLATAGWSMALLSGRIVGSTLVPVGWIHAWSMVLASLPPFIFAFLLTTFPRWLSQPSVPRPYWLLAAAAWLLGTLGAYLGFFYHGALVVIGMCSLLGSWAVITCALWRMAWRAENVVVHAWGVLLGLVFGGLSQCAALAWMVSLDARWFFLATRLAAWLFLLPIFCSVCHRMLPFFTRCVLPDTQLRRPALTLWLQVGAGFGHAFLETRHAYQWLFLPDTVLLGAALWHVWAWWPRARTANPLLWALHIGHLWLPLAAGLSAFQSLWLLVEGQFVLGRAPMHAFGVGFVGGLLVAMVTRVVQGHSGRPLVMPWPALIAFGGIQAAAVLRLTTEFGSTNLNGFAIAVWMIALLPWMVRIAWLVWTPRADGKAG